MARRCYNSLENPIGIETIKPPTTTPDPAPVTTHQKTRQGLKHRGAGRPPQRLHVTTHQKTRQGLKQAEFLAFQSPQVLNVTTHQKTRQGLKQVMPGFALPSLTRYNSLENPIGIETKIALFHHVGRAHVTTHQKTRQGLKLFNFECTETGNSVTTHQKTRQGLKQVIPGFALPSLTVTTHQKTRQGLKLRDCATTSPINLCYNSLENPIGIETGRTVTDQVGSSVTTHQKTRQGLKPLYRAFLGVVERPLQLIRKPDRD